MKKTVYNNIEESKVPGTPGKDYLKKLQKHNADYNKKHKHSLSAFGSLNPNAGNNEYNVAMFNHMNSPAGQPITPFTSDGGSLMSGDIGAPSGGDGGGDAGAGGAGGESLNNKIKYDRLEEKTLGKYVDVLCEGVVIDTIDKGDIIEYINDFRDGEEPSKDNSPLLFRDTISGSEVFSESVFFEAKDNRNTLGNKIKTTTLTGCAFYDKGGKLVDKQEFSNTHFGTTAKTDAIYKEMMKIAEENKYDSLILYNSGKVIKDSRVSVGSIGSKKDSGDNALIIQYSPNDSEDRDSASFGGGKLVVPKSDGKSMQFVEENTYPEIAKALFDASMEAADAYQYWMTSGDKILFDTIKPYKYPIGKALGITKKMMTNRLKGSNDKEKDKVAVAREVHRQGKLVNVSDTHKCVERSDYYIAFFDGDDKEVWRSYYRDKDILKMNKTELGAYLGKVLGNCDESRPLKIDKAIKAEKASIFDSKGRLILSTDNSEKPKDSAKPVKDTKELKFTYVAIKRKNVEYEISGSSDKHSGIKYIVERNVPITEIKAGKDIDAQVRKYMETNQLAKLQAKSTTTCILIIDNHNDVVAAKDDSRIMYKTNKNFLNPEHIDGAPTYNVTDNKIYNKDNVDITGKILEAGK